MKPSDRDIAAQLRMWIDRRTDRIVVANGRIERYKDQPEYAEGRKQAEQEIRFYTRERDILEEIRRRLKFTADEPVVVKRRVIEDDE